MTCLSSSVLNVELGKVQSVYNDIGMKVTGDWDSDERH